MPSILVFLFTMLIKCLNLLELIFTVKPQGLHVLLGETRQCIYVLCNWLLINQMALSFSINILTIFCCKTNLKTSEFLAGKENMFLHKKVFIYKVY